jgi:serine/threonine-protein kinase
MAEIYRVEHLDLGKQFALKIIAPELVLRERIRDLFYREARIMSQLDHPNIVKVTDFGVDPKHGAFIVMELLQGEALRTRLRREGGLTSHLVINLGIQIAEGLDYLHRANLLHCDIKSENVFLCQPPAGQPGRITAKLIDFGLSRSHAAAGPSASGSIRGTPHYLAPELIRGAPQAPSMDIYAFGVLLYEMATGECPFGGELDAVVDGHLMQPVPPIADRRSTPLDSHLEALILRALEKRPEDRQPTMGQVLYELRTVADMLGISPRRPSQFLRAARAPSSRTEGRSERRPPAVPAAEVGHCGFCPLPTFRADRAGVILSVNPAFAAFVGKPADALRGRRLADTRLAGIYPLLAEDLEAVATSFAPRQRTLSYHPTRTTRVSVLATILPEDSQGRPVLCGVMVPILEPDGR